MAFELITIQGCRVADGSRMLLPEVSWRLCAGEAWLVTGPNGGGKEDFLRALSGECSFVPGEGGRSEFRLPEGGVATVSLEAAAHLMAEERARDESEILDREDEGRTARQYVAEVLGGSSRKGAPLPPAAYRLESLPAVKLCGIEGFLDRGLRYLSTGEIRRTLLCRALLGGCSLLVLSDPFAGLDAASRALLLEFFDGLLARQLQAGQEGSGFPRIILCMERYHEIPSRINRVLEFRGRAVAFCGTREEYEASRREGEGGAGKREAFLCALRKIREGRGFYEDEGIPPSLIRFAGVNVGWGDHRVLVDMDWEVTPGEHWLIVGPNGSGKTTLLELVTGDNMQVFREDVRLFGRRRGSGETVWDIKRQLGIVSYRLHVEYRMVGGTTLRDAVISGFYDSIGLYQSPGDFEVLTALQWLSLAGLEGRADESFGSLSYGEQRVVLILRAAVKSPRVLILDEPCHGLDEDYRRIVLDLLEEIARTGTTTLLHVTHDPTEALPCEHRVLELRPGEVPMYVTGSR